MICIVDIALSSWSHYFCKLQLRWAWPARQLSLLLPLSKLLCHFLCPLVKNVWWWHCLKMYVQHLSMKAILPWASYQIRNIAGCTCAGNAGNVFPATNFKGNHSIAIPACITARVSCTCRDACRDRLTAVARKTFPAFPVHAQPKISSIWQEAH